MAPLAAPPAPWPAQVVPRAPVPVAQRVQGSGPPAAPCMEQSWWVFVGKWQGWHPTNFLGGKSFQGIDICKNVQGFVFFEKSPHPNGKSWNKNHLQTHRFTMICGVRNHPRQGLFNHNDQAILFQECIPYQPSKTMLRFQFWKNLPCI